MKRIARSWFFASLVTFLAGGAQHVMAQESSPDPLNKFIQDMFQMHQDKTLCNASATSPQAFRASVVDHLKATGTLKTATPQNVATALWTLFPCPFSPYRPELRLATSTDIEGAWLFPERSQKLRFAERSTQQTPAGAQPVKCDAVGYFANGELRHAIIAGKTKCPFEKAADLDIARKNPRVSSWSLLRDGRLSVTRTDVANHIEEWDVYVVVAPFSVKDVQFTAGDLVAYVRRENGPKDSGDDNAATQFRHLKRLP